MNELLVNSLVIGRKHERQFLQCDSNRPLRMQAFVKLAEDVNGRCRCRLYIPVCDSW